MQDSGIIVAAPYPATLSLNVDWPYVNGGWGQPGHKSGFGFNGCRMYNDGPPYSVSRLRCCRNRFEFNLPHISSHPVRNVP